MATSQSTGNDTPRPAKDPSRPLYIELREREIRLLYLAPGSPEDPLRGHLDVVALAYPDNSWCPARLASGAEYVALSYTWGDQSDPATIKLNGNMTLIGRNLASALKNVRLKERWCTLWADALCIDQQDDVEKSRQVQSMPTIYEAAKLVIVWLGDGFEGAEEAFAWLRGLWHIQEEVTLSLDRINALLSPLIAEALTRLLHLPWWRRVWVIQELTVCQEAIVMCGSSTVPFGCFITLANIMNTFIFTGRINQPDCSYSALMPAGQDLLTLAEIRCAWKRCDGSINLMELEALIRRTYLRTCATDARDHFYALLSIALTENWLELKPDYTITRDVLYLKATLHLIHRKSSLDILQLAENLHRSVDDPSWMPGWDKGSFSLAPREFIKGNASAGLELSLSPSEDLRVLTLLGLVIGELHFVSPFENEDNQFQPPRCIMGWLDELEDRVPTNPYSAACGLLEAFIRSLVAGHKSFVDEQDTHGEAPLRHIFLTWTKMTSPDSPMPPTWRALQESTQWLEKDLYRTPPANLRRHVLQSLNRRSFVITDKGHVGVTPNEAQEGDLAVLLGGCSTPVCLRHENGHYRWIGAMYVHGVMAGEIVENLSSADRSALTEFDIH